MNGISSVDSNDADDLLSSLDLDDLLSSLDQPTQKQSTKFVIESKDIIKR